jgi:hypothetical protein
MSFHSDRESQNQTGRTGARSAWYPVSAEQKLGTAKKIEIRAWNQNQKLVTDYAEPDWRGRHELSTESKNVRKKNEPAPVAL